MTTETFERTFALTGCGNFRDLGGYETADGRRTKWRTLFRSDALHQLNDDDIKVLSAAGIKLTLGFDLRSHVELENTGPGIVYECGARHVHVPIMKNVNTQEAMARIADAQMAEGQLVRLDYFDRLSEASESVGQVFRLLAETDSYPSVFYCAAGKDRTGIVAALILRALGVDDEDIVADYMLTRPMSEERREARMRELGWNIKIDPKLYEPSDEAMRNLLTGIDQTHGTVEAYLESCGVSSSVVERVKENLLA
jgi:protein-tyrosine phosphatase